MNLLEHMRQFCKDVRHDPGSSPDNVDRAALLYEHLEHVIDEPDWDPRDEVDLIPGA